MVSFNFQVPLPSTHSMWYENKISNDEKKLFRSLSNGSLADRDILEPIVIDLSISQKLQESYWLRNAREVITINYKSQDAMVPGDQRDIFGDDDIFILIREICLSSKSFQIFPALHKTHAIINPI